MYFSGSAEISGARTGYSLVNRIIAWLSHYPTKQYLAKHTKGRREGVINLVDPTVLATSNSKPHHVPQIFSPAH